jgi:hypothetical protein
VINLVITESFMLTLWSLSQVPLVMWISMTASGTIQIEDKTMIQHSNDSYWMTTMTQHNRLIRELMLVRVIRLFYKQFRRHPSWHLAKRRKEKGEDKLQMPHDDRNYDFRFDPTACRMRHYNITIQVTEVLTIISNIRQTRKREEITSSYVECVHVKFKSVGHIWLDRNWPIPYQCLEEESSASASPMCLREWDETLITH